MSFDTGESIRTRTNSGAYDAAGLRELEERTEQSHPSFEAPEVDEETKAKSEILNFILAHVWSCDAPLSLSKRIALAFKKFTVLSWQVNPELLDSASLAAIAAVAPISCTRACLSRISVQNSDVLGIVGGGQKSLGAREIYRTVCEQSWPKRRARHGANGSRPKSMKAESPEPEKRLKSKPSTPEAERAVVAAAQFAEHARQSAVRSEASALRSEEAASKACDAVAKLEE